ncbi:helix-turn-helix domain-containing protein [Nocardia transvalensis]|uniref:helix-turn-helix domain-containing protein n=1 Tax=Nocardia transvalensis TaxID=37333 RepID=UPI0018941339|nr:helix-turn-helix domain-containing protein [Nocardia transvalensis]MBF6329779.1 excisionase family DNA-binding protein [Nocardia transvalensis]
MDLIRLSEGAELVDVHVRTLRRWISQGKLTGYRLVSNQIRINRAELLGLIRPVTATTQWSSRYAMPPTGGAA